VGAVPTAVVVGTGETRYLRRPGAELTTRHVLAAAARGALEDAGLEAREVDGLGVSSFSLQPDRAIDLAVRLGLRLRWIADAGTGGASAVDLLQHAVRAVEAGDASAVLLVAGDVLRPADFRALVDDYNVATREHLAGIPHGGPNGIFAMLTRRHMLRHGLGREAYGRLVIRQRAWAAGNPNAAYRTPLTLREYLTAPMVADPLGVYDCPPVVSGADAVVVAASGDGPAVRAVRVLHNADRHEGDGLQTGLAEIAGALWEDAGAGPGEMDVVSVYDDYPAMVLVQLADLGFGAPAEVLEAIDAGGLDVNTSGGQLSAGQAGAAGGMHGLVEAVTQLRGRAGARQIGGARLAVVSGYGMVAYRHGACANAAVLESR
jgi:acetyl-CoA acetyltransferase